MKDGSCWHARSSGDYVIALRNALIASLNFELYRHFEDRDAASSSIMDSLTAYSSSEDEDDKNQTEIDPSESTKVVSKLKERFPLNSAPVVLGKVGIIWNTRCSIITPHSLASRRPMQPFSESIPKPKRSHTILQLTSCLLQRYTGVIMSNNLCKKITPTCR